MNPLHKKIHDQIVAPALGKMAGMVIGTVNAFDAKHNIATVTYSIGGDSKEIVKMGVPFAVTIGLKKAAPFPGDNVLLGFINNSYQHPVIIGILDKEHAFFTRPVSNIHFRKGSNIPDYYSAREGESW